MFGPESSHFAYGLYVRGKIKDARSEVASALTDVQTAVRIPEVRQDHPRQLAEFDYAAALDLQLIGGHFKPGARKGRGVVHLIGWTASWNTILSPKLTPEAPSVFILFGCSNSRDNRCSGWFYWKFVDYVDEPTF